LGFGRVEEAAGAAAEVGGTGEVGLGGGVAGAEGEDAGEGGDGAERGFGGSGFSEEKGRVWSKWKVVATVLIVDGELARCCCAMDGGAWPCVIARFGRSFKDW
jgi:hypothetical protein